MALKGVLLQVKDIVNIWQMSALDGIVWICTYVTVIIVEIDIGLLVGLIVSIVTILFRGLRPYVYRLSRLPNTDIYVERSKYGKVRLVNSSIYTKIGKAPWEPAGGARRCTCTPLAQKHFNWGIQSGVPSPVRHIAALG